jgi:hypothetical protein
MISRPLPLKAPPETTAMELSVAVAVGEEIESGRPAGVPPLVLAEFQVARAANARCGPRDTDTFLSVGQAEDIGLQTEGLIHFEVAKAHGAAPQRLRSRRSR